MNPLTRKLLLSTAKYTVYGILMSGGLLLVSICLDSLVYGKPLNPVTFLYEIHHSLVHLLVIIPCVFGGLIGALGLWHDRCVRCTVDTTSEKITVLQAELVTERQRLQML